MSDAYIEIENIKVFGKRDRTVSVSDIESIELDISTQIHLVRHFSSLKYDYLQSLVGKSYTYFNSTTKQFEESIVNQNDFQVLMNSKGSKFYNLKPMFADPSKIIQSIKQFGKEYASSNQLFWIDKKGTLICLFSIHFDEPIGECGIAKLSDLPFSIQNTIKEENRGESLTDNYTIKTVRFSPLPTNSLSVQLRKSADTVVVDTAYPGGLPVDDPDKSNQSQEEYEYNKWYWDNYVFLI